MRSWRLVTKGLISFLIYHHSVLHKFFCLLHFRSMNVFIFNIILNLLKTIHQNEFLSGVSISFLHPHPIKDLMVTNPSSILIYLKVNQIFYMVGMQVSIFLRIFRKIKQIAYYMHNKIFKMMILTISRSLKSKLTFFFCTRINIFDITIFIA